jgi:hypothetical protein
VHALDLLLPLLLLDLGILNREFQEPLTGVLDLLLSGDELPSLVFQVFKMATSNTQAELPNTPPTNHSVKTTTFKS